MNIRCSNCSDYPAIAEIEKQAFGRDNEARLVELIRESDRYIPELELVAEINNAVVGHVLFSYIDLLGQENWQVLGLSPIAVRSQFQRRGIGSALIGAGLEAADVRGEAMAIVLGDPQFYSRFGFQPSVGYGVESPFPVPEEFFLLKPLKNYQELHRGKIAYPPSFNVV